MEKYIKNFNYKFQSQLLSIQRSLSKVFRNWLTPDELKLNQANQILIYFERTANTKIQKRVLSKLSNETKALLKNIVVKKHDICAGEALAITASQGFDVSLSNLAELHFRGIVFMENFNFWPSDSNDWTAEHALQPLVLIPDININHISVKTPDFDIPIFSGNIKEIVDNNNSKPASELYDFLNFISRKEIKLTEQKKFTARTQRIIQRNLKQQHENSLFNFENFLSFSLKKKIVKIDSIGVVVPGKNFLNFRKEKPAEQLKLFLDFSFQAFQKLGKFNNRFEIPPFFLNMLFNLLQKNSENNWLYFDNIISFMEKKADYTFSVQKGYKGWNWRKNLQKIPPKENIKKIVWNLLDIYFTLSSSIEIGKTEKSSVCFRLTDFGKFWTQNCFMPEHDDSEHKLTVMPDFNALLIGSGPLDSVSQTLGLFGKRKGDYNASVFHFSRKTIQSAVRHGHSVDELFKCFKKNCSYPVPNNVKSSLLEWGSLSVETELFCDVNLFSFENESERKSYTLRFSHKPENIGKKFAMVNEPENIVLNIMKNINAFPVDYSLSPVKPLEIKIDGEVICGKTHDLRLISLRNSISEIKNEKYYLSEKVMKKNRLPKVIYQKFLKLTPDKISLNAKINVLIGLGMIDETVDDEYFIVENLIPEEKRKLKKITNLKKMLLAKLSKNSFIIDKQLYELISNNIFDIKIKLFSLKLKKMVLFPIS